MRHANAKWSRVSIRVTKQIARAGPWHGRPKKILSSRSIIVKKFSWRVSNRVGKAVPKKLGDAGAPAPWHGAWVIVRNTPLPTCVTVTNLVVLRQTVRAYIPRLSEKMRPSHPAFQDPWRSSEPTRIDRLPVTSCYWYTVIMGLARTFSRVNGVFGRKSENFVHPVYSTPPLTWFLLEFSNGDGLVRTIMMPLIKVKNVNDIWFLFDTISQHDGQTDQGW